MTDILSLPTTSISGAATTVSDSSPYMIVPKVINASWNYGVAKADAYSGRIESLFNTGGVLNSVSTPTHVSAGTVAVPSLSAPGVTIPATASTTDVMSLFDTKYLELVQLLSDKFSNFRATYFPSDTSDFATVEAWLVSALSNPDSALPPAIQAQIWEDDRSRITDDKIRAQDSAMAQFAARRFPLPSGAAASMVLQIEQKAQDELADSSRKIAMMQVELQKFSVEKMLALRHEAMADAIEYIKALASGPEMATKLLNIGYDAQSKLISSAAAFYGAEVQAAEVVTKANQFNVTTALEAAMKNQATDIAMVDAKVKALMSEAEALAKLASSLFNNVHVQAGVSGSTSNSVGYSYSNDTSSSPGAITSIG